MHRAYRRGGEVQVLALTNSPGKIEDAYTYDPYVNGQVFPEDDLRANESRLIEVYSAIRTRVPVCIERGSVKPSFRGLCTRSRRESIETNNSM